MIDASHRAASSLLVLALACGFAPPATADGLTYEVGAGLGFADADSGGLDGGWDVMFGVEWSQRRSWSIGTQVHVLRGWTSDGDVFDESDLAFDSVALNFTFRPTKPAVDWIQLRAGIVRAEFVDSTGRESGLGWALGAGAVLGGDSKLRVHLFDYSRYQVEGESFHVYSVSFVWCGILAWR